MGLPPWEIGDGQQFVLVTGVNSGLGHGVCERLIDEFVSSPSISHKKHLVLILCTRSAIKTKFTISRLRAHTRRIAEFSPFAADQRSKGKAQGAEYKWEDTVQRVHFLGVEADLCDLKSVYALADRLVNGTVGTPDATDMDGHKLPHASPGTSTYSPDVKQDRWALTGEIGSRGWQRTWGWGLSGIRVPRLDVIILNAGMGDWKTIAWFKATWVVLTDTINAVTWPSYKVPNIGTLVKPQLGPDQKAEPPLGLPFCSNIFGHYLLVHELMPLLSKPASSESKRSGRIVWVSSIEAVPKAFDFDDFQGLKSATAYESTKRLADLLAITSDLPYVKHISAPYFDASITSTAIKKASKANGDKDEDKLPLIKPTMHTVHPGIFASSIVPLNFLLVAAYTAIFYFARWLGSPWHVIDAYKASVAPVWLALTQDEVLEEMEFKQGKGKWGSATNVKGEERVMRTEVDGWGWDGKVSNKSEAVQERKIGRHRDAVALTQEALEDFEVLGAKCWAEMEALREEWEDLLDVQTAS